MTLVRMTIAVCITDARWCYQNRNDERVMTKCMTDEKYARTFAQYLPLGRYIETGA